MTKSDHEYMKELREQYAYQVLQLVDSERYRTLKKRESPDYITPGHEIGVEVVSVSPDGSQEAESLFLKVARGKPGSMEGCIARLNKIGAELIYDTEETPIGIVEPAYWVTFEPIEKAVVSKLGLLNSVYEQCSSNELFVYTEIGPGPEGWESCLSQLRVLSESSPVHFNRIILNEPWLLMVFDIDENRCFEIRFTDEDYANCRGACR